MKQLVEKIIAEAAAFQENACDLMKDLKEFRKVSVEEAKK